MKKILIFGMLIMASTCMFSQKIISSKGEQKEINGMTYLIINYNWKNGGRSETTVDMGDGLTWQFFDQIAKKQRKIFASQTELLNYMYSHGWKYKSHIPGYTAEYQKIIFIRQEYE
ncbi:MAG: hypothetical protein GXO47_09965 [Chlorobi bacterium]|nr:hypothetical protein [Chlorobiota bacterium]